MKTILHTFNFDTTNAAGLAAWNAFKLERKSGPHCHGPVLSDVYHPFVAFDGVEIELETKHLFENQWNTVSGCISETGSRVFDYALQSDSAPHAGGKMSAPRGIRRGHWLEQTADMKEIRRNTMACGYCGKQEPAAKGNVFCPHCIDSEYLKPADLKLTRMRAIEDGNKPFVELSEAETAYLMPLYTAAQTHGTTERGKARLAAKRADIEKTYKAKLANAETEYQGFKWLIDHGVTSDPIFYAHTGRFGFGWRTPLSADVVSALLEVISEFGFPYDIKCDNGKTLSGN